jgi:intracellular multiplication protein IcmG
LIVIAAILGAVGWYLFGPERAPSVNQLAFQEDMSAPAALTDRATVKTVMASPSETGLGQLQSEIAGMVSGLSRYAETNRTAIERLAQTLDAQSAATTALQQQIIELQAQLSLQSAQSAHALDGKTVVPVSVPKTTKPVSKARSPLQGMHLAAVQHGMAWVYWQHKTWAVKVGDPLGNVTVTGIDAVAREVRTSAGTLK